MINVLIIDDDSRKTENIVAVIRHFEDIPSDSIQVSTCINESKSLLRSNQYDLVILDIQLPLRGESDPLPTGGLDLLREIHERTIYIKPKCIIGLSAYEDKVLQASPLFKDKLWSVILYDQTQTTWSDQIERKIEYILESSKHSSKVNEKYQSKLAIITALPTPEFDAVKQLTDWEDKEILDDSTRYLTGVFISGEKQLPVVAACAPQMGMPSASVLATKMILHFQPEYLCMVGISAGIKGKVKLGDIVVADPSWDWATGKLHPTKKGTMLHPDPLPERLEPKAKTLLRDAELDKSLIYDIWNGWCGTKPDVCPVLNIGPSVSGASVVADSSVVEEIISHNRKLIGLEMEAYGVMHAASYASVNKPIAFSMKGICDFANESKNDELQKFCAHLSANLLKKIALKYF